MKYANLFYYPFIAQIGGIETWYYEIAKKYGKYDITLMYENGDKEQIKRLSKYIRCVKRTSKDTVECKNLFVNYLIDIVPYCKYEKLYYFDHCDFKSLIQVNNFPQSRVLNIARTLGDKCNYIGVSKIACASWKEITGVDMKLCYNPVSHEKQKKLIRLCSAQRMSVEKGLKRIKELANALDTYAKNHDYLWEWDIYTNDTDKVENRNVYYKKPTLDVAHYFSRYDWFVVLSDNEGYCYSAIENLIRGVPLVRTPCPVFEELNIDNKCSIIMNFDCSNIASIVDDIFNKKMTFKYVPPKSTIGDLLVKDPSTYQPDIENKVKVTATALYERANIIDGELGYIPKVNEEWVTDIDRAEMLRKRGYIK